MTPRKAAALADAHLGRRIALTGTVVGITTSTRWVEVTVRVEVEDVVEVTK